MSDQGSRPQLSDDELRDLPIEERLRMLDQIWSTLAEQPSKMAVPEWHLDEINSRLADHAASPKPDLDWDEMKAELLSILRA